MDIIAWNRVKSLSCSTFQALSFYLLAYPEFRNLFLFRIKDIWFRDFLKILFPPLNTLYIACEDIGGGLFIQHGFSTIIAAKKIGENCWINQQVTIGYKKDKAPILGNNICVYAGVIIIGDIHLGDNVKCGAGAVVVKNIPSGKTVVGNPAHYIN